MSVNTGNFGELLEPGLRTIWGDKLKAWPREWTKIFDKKTSKKGTEHTLSMTGFSPFAVKAQGAGVEYEDPLQGFKHSVSHVVYAKGFVVTLEMYEDDQYNKINALPSALARAGEETVEIVHANILNRAFTAGYTGGDGIVLCSTGHLLEGGGTFSNKLSVDADLSMTSLEQALIDIGAFVNGRNLKAMVKAKQLIVPTALEWTAIQLLKSEKDPETPNNAKNPAMGIMPYTVNHYLTDPDAWFIQTDAENGLVSYWRREFAFTKDNDHDSDNAKFKQTFRFVATWDDPRCIFGSSGG